MKPRVIIAVLFLTFFGNITAYSQVCQQLGSVEIRLQDENERPVENATLKFVDIPKGSALENRQFTEYHESYGALYVSTYCESEIVGKQGKNGFTRAYDVLVNAKGYREAKAKVSIYHCLGQCLANRSFITIVNESAKLVTIQGTVKLSDSTVVSAAPIKFKRSNMVEFSTTSDANGNYQITVPAGTYSVHAKAKAGCFMCVEYFGNIVGTDDPTVLNIILRFYPEGKLRIFEDSRPKVS
jgi:hypothetical protein